MRDKHSILETHFGYTSFRPGQEEVIDALLAGQDTVGIMPTGAGKSVCFQIPALLFEGVSLVVSPLISLMKDQVTALLQAGVAAAYLNSSQSAREQSMVLDQVREGSCRILYVAPERLDTGEFLACIAACEISFVSVDEAHCVSQWGQDFRPSYLRIPDFLNALPRRPVIGAFTATATARVLEDMISLLGLREPQVFTTGYDRPNLFWEVRMPGNKYRELGSFLKERREKSGIVYCLTRKSVEDVCERLCADGYSATRYHAGLTPEERRQNQEGFQEDRYQVMVATNAFGMGIDKSNVAYVVHYNMPKNMESYYQEAGRAGRDGSPAECLLLYSGQDVITNQFFIDKAGDNGEMDPDTLAEYQRQERERLKWMTFYCHTQDCLRRYILKYFGETGPERCGNCGNCNYSGEKVDITVDAQKILSCVKRMGERYGVGLVVDTLRGSKSERVLQLGFDTLSTYGIMADASDKRVREMVNYLVAQECLKKAGDEYPVLRLGPRAKGVLFGGERLSMNAPREKKQVKEAAAKRKAVVQVSNPELYAKLQALRFQLAKAQSVPAYVVFNDATLREMCTYLPKNQEELSQINGVGQIKLQKYGEAFLQAIRQEVE